MGAIERQLLSFSFIKHGGEHCCAFSLFSFYFSKMWHTFRNGRNTLFCPLQAAIMSANELNPFLDHFLRDG